MASPQTPISIIIIGVHRLTALDLAPALASTPYTIAAVLDLHESPGEFQYSARNLGTLLHTLHPRPRVLVTGTAVAGIVEEVRGVWEGYTEGVLRKEHHADGKWRYVPVEKVPVPALRSSRVLMLQQLSDYHSEDGPPPPGVMEYLMEKLNETFE